MTSCLQCNRQAYDESVDRTHTDGYDQSELYLMSLHTNSYRNKER